MKTPLFSIIIPTLNEENYLPLLLNDLTCQTQTDFEVIVIDGNSQDHTVINAEKIISGLNLKIYELPLKNAGQQRNYGAKKARGKFLLFLDADIRLAADFLFKLAKNIRQSPFQIFTVDVTTDSTKISDKILVWWSNFGHYLTKIIKKPYIPGYAFMMEKNIFQKSEGFRQDIVYGEEFDLSNRAGVMKFKFGLYRQPRVILSLRRFHRDGIIKTFLIQNLSSLYMYFHGPITKKIFSYPMGGKGYKLSQATLK